MRPRMSYERVMMLLTLAIIVIVGVWVTTDVQQVADDIHVNQALLREVDRLAADNHRLNEQMLTMTRRHEAEEQKQQRALVETTRCGMSSTPGCDTARGRIFMATNAYRQNRGQARLDWGSSIALIAQAHAVDMATVHLLHHNELLALEAHSYRLIGENVGVGPGWRSVQEAFYASAGHRANILDADYSRVGVGVAWSHGQIWVVVVFKAPV